MLSTSKIFGAFAIVAGLFAAVPAADARPRPPAHHRVGPVVQAPAYAAYDSAYGAGGAEEFNGTSVPYDPDGPGYNDFQLQGSN